jgi:hypothetical protein
VQELLDSDEGWLCPACDCRYDILWALAQTLDLEFEELTELRCVSFHSGAAPLDRASGKGSIALMAFP